MSETTTKPTKQALLKAFKEDLRSADTLRLEIVSKAEQWRNEYEGKPYGNEQEGKSKIVSRDIKRQDEWQHASIKDPFVSDTDIIKCSPVTAEDRKPAEQNQLVLNYQFTRQFTRYKFITDVIKLFYKEGTVFVKTSWDYDDEEVEEEVPVYAADPLTGEPTVVGVELVKKLNVLVNKPNATICRLEDIYIDPTCEGSIDNAQFIIHRYESDLSSLRKAGKYENLDKLKGHNGADSDSSYEETDDTNFKFKDEPRKKLVVYEYWGNYDRDNTGIVEPIVCTWVNDTIIQLESNPYPDQSLPFLVVANNSTPFKVYGEANAELVGDNQKITTAIKRGIIDNMANSNNAQKGIRMGALDTINEKRYLNGKNFVFNGSTADFYDGSYNQLPNSVFDVLTLVNNETESMLGVKSFSGGITGSGLGSTATSARGALDAVSVRKLDIVRNLAENLIKPLMRKWMSYNSEFLQEEEVIRITNEQFIPIRRDDLKGNIDIEIEVSTAEDNAAKGQQLSFLLQTLGQGMDPGMQKLVMGQIAKLHKMPDLAKMLEEYQPQPDPYVQEMRMLELQMKKVEIMERQSRAEENAADLRLKTANAVLAEANARDRNSTADLKDLDFTSKMDGREEQARMAEKDHDRTTQIMTKQLDNLTKQ